MQVDRCREAAALLAAHVEGELGAVETARLRAHLDVCRACRAQEAGYRAALGALGAVPKPAVPPGMLSDFHARLDASRSPVRPVAPLRLRWAAAALVVLVVGASGASVWRALTADPIQPARAVTAGVPAPAPVAAAPDPVAGGPPPQAALPPATVQPMPSVPPRVVQAPPAPAQAYRPPQRERLRPRVVREGGPAATRVVPERPQPLPDALPGEEKMTPHTDEHVQIGGQVTHVRTATGEDRLGRKLVRVEIVTEQAEDTTETVPGTDSHAGGPAASE